MPDNECRIARLEQSVEDQKQQLSEYRCACKSGEQRILEAVESIKVYQQKQQGFIGGVTLTISAIFTVIVALFSYFHKG